MSGGVWHGGYCPGSICDALYGMHGRVRLMITCTNCH